MQFASHGATVHVVQNAKPGRPSEDTYFAHADAGQIVALVADGAPQRIRTTANMKPLLETFGPETSPGRCAALITRDIAAGKLITERGITLTEAVLAANDHLRAGLENVYGALTAEAILQHKPELAFLNDEPRLLRLILPVCCVTVARVDVNAGALEYAHGGDTALFLFYRDGRVVRATRDQMIQHDGRAVEAAQQIKAETGAAHLVDVVTAERVRDINIGNGIYHNFEDPIGATDPAVGVGVINGLPALAAYLETGRVPLDELAGFLVCSDGFPPHDPPASKDDESAATNRLLAMRAKVEADGLAAYIADLREIEADDAGLDTYPRLGQYDDATAIYVKLI